MIERWTWPAYVGVLLGAALFVAFLIPILVWESQRHGQIRLSRLIGAAMVAIYGVALAAYTLLPLPTGDWCATHPAPGVNLRPGAFIHDVRAYYLQYGGRRLLTSFVFLQVALNVLLFVPWGALWRRFFGGGIITATFSGFLMSCVIETTQATGAYGLLPCAYRVGDVDDVITNTSGALIGAVLAPLLLFFLPDPRSSVRTRGNPRPVTRRRRLVGMAIDVAIFWAVQGALVVSYRVLLVYGLGRPLALQDEPWETFISAVAAFLLVVLGPTFWGSGASLGQRAVWLRPRWERPGPGRAALRSLCGFGGWALLTVVASWPGLPESASGALGLAAAVVALAALIALVTDPSARGLSLRATGAELEDSRSRSGDG